MSTVNSQMVISSWLERVRAGVQKGSVRLPPGLLHCDSSLHRQESHKGLTPTAKCIHPNSTFETGKTITGELHE